MWFLYISWVLLLLYVLLIAFYKKGWQAMPHYELQPRPMATYSTTVTVIIPARNEEQTIATCIKSVLAQSYPQALLQIIVVNDQSTDATFEKAASIALANSHVQIINLHEVAANNAYKKKAINQGITQATGTLIITTDADCTHGPHWIESIVQFYEKTGAQFIAAPVNYTTTNQLLSVFQTLDFMTMQGITGASVYRQFHTMCNGANLAYTKAAFLQVGGFAGIDNIPSGDDMLLMHKIYKQYPSKVYYFKCKQAIVATAPAATWHQFFQQRIRWASKATHFTDKRIFITLLLVYIFNVWFLLLAIALFFNAKLGLVLLALLALKTLAELWFLAPVAQFFNQSKWLNWFAFLQPLHILYIIVSGWLGKFGKYTWKGRIIKQ
jgi:poly-beta-1,6-N-acetyl-D-glucosamine synthase